jgi:hypothetical protein
MFEPIPNDGFAVRGRVVAVDSVSRTITLSDCVSTPGEGVGSALEPGLCVAQVADGVAMPIVGRLVTAHPSGWWSYLDDHGAILDRALDHIEAAIANLGLLPETASVDELARIDEAAHYLALALNALSGDD